MTSIKLRDGFEYVSISVYAEEHGVPRKNILLKCQRGSIPHAKLHCGRWIIRRNEPMVDRRFKAQKGRA